MEWWWGYLHKDGTYRVGMYTNVADIIKTNNHFSAIVTTGPFLAADHDDATEKIKPLIELQKSNLCNIPTENQ